MKSALTLCAVGVQPNEQVAIIRDSPLETLNLLDTAVHVGLDLRGGSEPVGVVPIAENPHSV